MAGRKFSALSNFASLVKSLASSSFTLKVTFFLRNPFNISVSTTGVKFDLMMRDWVSFCLCLLPDTQHHRTACPNSGTFPCTARCQSTTTYVSPRLKLVFDVWFAC